MSAVAESDPSTSQVLVNLGNRYVVFGPAAALPRGIAFDPDKDSLVLPRVADESEIAEERIAETLRIMGFETIQSLEVDGASDLIVQDHQGNQTLIELKVRERDLKRRDIDRQIQWLLDQHRAGLHAEVWNFNIDRLKIIICKIDSDGMPLFSEMDPIDVWEKTESGVFRRTQVIERVEDWTKRILDLYRQIECWLSNRIELTIDRSRTVVLSEEIMQKYAVPDRELEILDVLCDKNPLISFVPRALYIVGGRGRIDIITENGTRLLVDQGEAGVPNWRLASLESRRETIAFDRSALEGLLGSR